MDCPDDPEVVVDSWLEGLSVVFVLLLLGIGSPVPWSPSPAAVGEVEDVEIVDRELR